MFRVNENFQSKLRRITYPVPVLEELVKKEKITQDRSHAIDAQLVRIMKSRKQLSRQDLIKEVYQYLTMNFKPEPALINKRIDSLMQRDYIEQSSADDSILVYKA